MPSEQQYRDIALKVIWELSRRIPVQKNFDFVDKSPHGIECKVHCNRNATPPPRSAYSA